MTMMAKATTTDPVSPTDPTLSWPESGPTLIELDEFVRQCWRRGIPPYKHLTITMHATGVNADLTITSGPGRLSR